MEYGEGVLTTVYDRVNFYKDVKNDPDVHFKRDGNNITLIAGDGTIINDKLIAKTEDAFNHEFDTYIPLKTKLNKNQKIVLEWLKEEWSGRKRHSWLSLECIATLVYHWQHGDPDYYPAHAAPHVEAYGALTAVGHLEVLQVFSQWALEQEEEQSINSAIVSDNKQEGYNDQKNKD